MSGTRTLAPWTQAGQGASTDGLTRQFFCSKTGHVCLLTTAVQQPIELLPLSKQTKLKPTKRSRTLDFRAAIQLVNDHAVSLILDPAAAIRGLGIGTKNGGALSPGADLCITAFVDSKLTESDLRTNNITPFAEAFANAIPDQRQRDISEFDVDVVEVRGPFETLAPTALPMRGRYGGNPPALNAQKAFDSLRCGIGITNPNGYPKALSVGTAGFYLRDDAESVYVVSNNHVIGGSNNGQRGEMIVQPGTLDLTRIEFALMPRLTDLQPIAIGELTAVVPLRFNPPTNAPINRVDAAIAKLNSSRLHNDLARLTYGGYIRAVAPPYEVANDGSLTPDGRVYKVGRTTGYTEGNVTNVAVTTGIDYPGGKAIFADQIGIEATPDNEGPFSDSGDSGSAVLNANHELVGLLFAGSPLRTLANPIDLVMKELSTLVGVGLTVVTG